MDRNANTALRLNSEFWVGRRVFVTGHTGFMGGWMCLWLMRLGAQVSGYALPPPTRPSLFEATGLAARLHSTFGDVGDLDRLSAAMAAAEPEVVFHLAAQPLVRHAHAEPIETFRTNVMGTVNLLQAMRAAPSLRACVVVTTDKVYDNREWDWGYRENDRLGGHEPYGASKACAEIAVDAYRDAYFRDAPVGIATVRAGNIVGGGDWAADRLIPDAVRAFADGSVLGLRHPEAVRPWQHVLEPVAGMLALAERLAGEPAAWAGGWNFGPADSDARPVAEVADALVRWWGDGAAWRHTGPERAAPAEQRFLSLSSAKAALRLGWRPRWGFERTIENTVAWYRAHLDRQDMLDLSCRQIAAYQGAN
ncbi:MAG: CDP-glucose 4,6-dehydratase [Rhodospirillales bacterium]